MTQLPTPRGRLTPQRALSELTWLRVGGPADWVFQPADAEDLATFLAELDPIVPVFPMGAGSNLIVRDGGLAGVVIKLGRPFMEVDVSGECVTAGAAVLDARLARAAADAGIDLTFLRTIPGTLGGALKMNAGCYGSYMADHVESADLTLRDGRKVTLAKDDITFGYRQTDVPDDAVITSVTLRGPRAEPATLHERMAEQIARRDASQPTRERSAGSTFRNPAGFSSTGRSDDVHDLKAWKVIDNAGMRGATRGGAQMSQMHSNFMINRGGATAADLEGLGEEVRKRVYETQGIDLEWEIMRVGRPASESNR